MVICSWRQQACMRRSRRLFAEPLSTNNMKDTSCSLMSWHSTSPSYSNIFLAPEGTACVCVCVTAASLCVPPAQATASGFFHVPEKDMSVKCLDAVLGKVHLPCWSFIVVRNGFGVVFWHSISRTVSVAWLLSLSDDTRKVFFRHSRWFRQARKPQLTACGEMAKSARCCSPRPSCRFATRTVEQWALHSQGTIAFYPTRCGRQYCPPFSSSYSCLPHVVVCLMFPVFLA